MTDHETLITASFALAMLALALISALWMDRRLMAKYPRLLSTAGWCMIGAGVAAIVAEAHP